MKKLCMLLIAAFLLSLGASAWAEEGVTVEVITMDGETVVVVTPLESISAGFGGADFVLPSGLVAIWDSAFEGVGAERIEVSDNVGAIGPRAFADCLNLTAILIPASVESIDDTAFQGSENVTIYGAANSEAKLFADASGIPFVPVKLSAEFPSEEAVQPPATLPFLSLN